MKHFIVQASMLSVFLLFTTLQSCREDEPDEESVQPAIQEELEDFSSIKTDDWRSKIGTDITTEGYLIPVSARIFKLVNDSSFAHLNTILPDRNYILIQLPQDDHHVDSYEQLSTYTGAKVKITGVLADFKPRDVDGESLLLSSELMGDKAMATVTLKAYPTETGRGRVEIATKDFKDIVDVLRIKPLPENRTRFALLYSGGIDAAQAYTHYYNNLRVMYELLLKQGYRAENIVVVYKAGMPESMVYTSLPPYFKYYPEIPVHHAATPEGLSDAIAYLKNEMKGQNAELFLMTTNHGGGYHAGQKRYYEGQWDTNNDEPASDAQKLDEVISCYNDDRVISDDEFAAKVNTLPFVALKALFLQCFSGGMIHDFKGPNRVLMSATTEYEFSWGGGSQDLDFFFANFIVPVYAYRAGDITSPIDIDKDGQLTMYEIFLFARALQDVEGKQWPENRQSPQYDDDGDGVPNQPTSTGFGAKVTL